MSKRQSVGGGSSNTLFNYFTKTPPATKKSRSTEEETSSPSTPRTSEKKIKEKTNKEQHASPGLTSKSNSVEDERTSSTPLTSEKNSQKTKRERPQTKSPETAHSGSDEDSPIKPRKKRIRLYPIDSDDSDTENKADNLPSTPKETIGKKLQDSFKYESKSSPKDQADKPSNEKRTSSNTAVKAEVKLEPVETLSDEGNWIHCKLEWLKPDKVRDAKKRKPDHPDYDPKTLFVPDDFMKTQTPAHRQWWEMKSSHFDCVLFFKVGKFYELFHMDAAVGVNELGFSYMKGEYAHSGFPESAYARMASTLVSKGYKVARVEQTETPDMMQERCKRTGQTSKFDKVVKREICQVTCKGTEVATLLENGPHEASASYLTAITEEEVNGRSVYGVCFVDTSIGLFHMGQFEDDKHSSRLLTMFAHHPPALVLYERKTITARTSKLVTTHCHSARREPSQKFPAADETLVLLANKYYRTNDDGEWPDDLKPFLHPGHVLGLTPAPDCELAVRALGGCVSYLADSLLDVQVLGMARYEAYSPPDVLSQSLSQETSSKGWEGGNTMVLDAITLRNLRIVGEEGSLYDKLNYCVTPMGKRLLRQWVCWPSCRLDVIRERQEAVAELYNDASLCSDVREVLSLQPDLERLLAKIHTLGNRQRSKSHPDARAIFFEENKYTKKKVQDFIALINGFKSALKLIDLLSDSKSELLRRISQLPPEGKFPDYVATLKTFETSFNHSQAEKEGKIVPSKGVDSEYDNALETIADIELELQQYLKEQEKHFKCRVNYVGSDKKRYQLEVVESAATRAGSHYQLEGARKGYKRFSTSTTRDLLARMLAAEEQKTSVLRDLSRRIFERFSEHARAWAEAVVCLATLDLLVSLAEFARQQPGEVCLPRFVHDDDDKPLIDIEEGRHPCIAVAGEFIPNDSRVGGARPSLLLLTGANMGGKSTLMRQVALITLIAHLGGHVPARACSLSLVDRIFTRLGASDDILSGQSTFLVEMSETAAIVKHATRHSLVLCDELGRGTSTYDGCALASGVAAELADRACRVIFSTHYHHLVHHLSSHPNVMLGHMACMVETEEAAEGEVAEESITFLYKLSPGACPKSYGFNAARLAGIPGEIIRRGQNVAKKMEREANCVRAFRNVLNGNIPLREMLAGLKI